MLQELSKEHLHRMNIGRRYWGAEFKNVPDLPHKVMLEKYIENYVQMFREGWGFFLWGDNSQGKTYAATALLKEMVRRRKTAYCIVADELKKEYIVENNFDEDQSIPQRCETVDFLLLEDIGKEYSGKGSGWAELCLENLIRKRTRELLPTVITTNINPGEFKQRYKKSAFAMVMECMTPIEVVDKNYRAKAANKKLAWFNE